MKTGSPRLKNAPGILAALREAAECLKVLAHPQRLRMIQLLLRERYTVGEVADSCGLPSHMASEHLRLMQRCGFLTSVKVGRKAYYRVTEPHLADLLACVEDRFGLNGGQSPRHSAKKKANRE